MHCYIGFNGNKSNALFCEQAVTKGFQLTQKHFTDRFFGSKSMGMCRNHVCIKN